MDLRIRRILDRGGILHPGEYDLLKNHLHRTDGVEEIDDYTRVYTIFFLPEVKGYCTVYTITDCLEFCDLPTAEAVDKLFIGTDDKEATKLLRKRQGIFERFGPSNHEYITKLYRKLTYPKNYEMVFHDATYWKTFSTYKELEQDYLENGIPDYLENPLADPDFKVIYERGEMLSQKDYEVFLAHCNYIDYENPYLDKYGWVSAFDNVFESPYVGRISVKMDSREYECYLGYEEKCAYKGGFKQEWYGKIAKDYTKEAEESK